MHSEMPVPRFLYKVKNTFIEDVKDDDSLSDINDEDMLPRRQITEPSPPTLSLFRSSSPERNAEKTILQRNTAYAEKIKSIEDSSCSDDDRSDKGRKTSEPFEPEWEPDFQKPYVQTEWSMLGTTEAYWSNWNDLHLEPDMESASMRRNYNSLLADQSSMAWQNTAPPMGYGVLPILYSPMDNISMRGVAGTTLPDHRVQSAAQQDSVQNAQKKLARRRRRESLIDVAARRQKQQANQAAKQRKGSSKRNQTTSSAQPTTESAETPAKETADTPAKCAASNFCSQCGDPCQSHFKFCKFCGSPVSQA